MPVTILATALHHYRGLNSRDDGTIEFYARVNALLRPEMQVLDFGAGRGALLEDDPVPFRRSLATIHGKVARVVAADLDDAVLQNGHCDEGVLLHPGSALPFADASFDLVLADWVLEHVDDAASLEREMRRILKTGGWFCARTPNKYGLTGLGTRVIPNRYHARLLQTLQPGRKAEDVFPVRYRMNSLRAISRIIAPAEWSDHSYVTNAEPPYARRSSVAMAAVFLYWRVVPAMLRTNIHMFVQRLGPVP